MTSEEQFFMFGKLLNGDESKLTLCKLSRIRYLKEKMRTALKHTVGDDPDMITDVVRANILCYAVLSGIITDTSVINRLNVYVSEMIIGYGGAESIMGVLEFDKESISNHVIHGFFIAKKKIMESSDEDYINSVDLPSDQLYKDNA